jgi:hypothetical protein
MLPPFSGSMFAMWVRFCICEFTSRKIMVGGAGVGGPCEPIGTVNVHTSARNAPSYIGTQRNSPILQTSALKTQATCTSETWPTLSTSTWCNYLKIELRPTISTDIFVYSTTSRPALGPHTASYPMGSGGSFSGVKCPVRDPHLHLVPNSSMVEHYLQSRIRLHLVMLN